MNPSKLVALLEKDLLWAKDNSNQNLEATIIAGLNWETNYWTECALNWLEQGYPINEKIFELLEKVSRDSKRKNQRTRHRAIKLSIKWKSNNLT